MLFVCVILVMTVVFTTFHSNVNKTMEIIEQHCILTNAVSALECTFLLLYLQNFI